MRKRRCWFLPYLFYFFSLVFLHHSLYEVVLDGVCFYMCFYFFPSSEPHLVAFFSPLLKQDWKTQSSCQIKVRDMISINWFPYFLATKLYTRYIVQMYFKMKYLKLKRAIGAVQYIKNSMRTNHHGNNNKKRLIHRTSIYTFSRWKRGMILFRSWTKKVLMRKRSIMMMRILFSFWPMMMENAEQKIQTLNWLSTYWQMHFYSSSLSTFTSTVKRIERKNIVIAWHRLIFGQPTGKTTPLFSLLLAKMNHKNQEGFFPIFILI